MKSFVDFHGELFFVIQVGWVSFLLTYYPICYLFLQGRTKKILKWKNTAS